jgi:hypothetical protein
VLWIGAPDGDETGQTSMRARCAYKGPLKISWQSEGYAKKTEILVFGAEGLLCGA